MSKPRIKPIPGGYECRGRRPPYKFECYGYSTSIKMAYLCWCNSKFLIPF